MNGLCLPFLTWFKGFGYISFKPVFKCRVFPNGEVQHLHPKDGVYPEKVNPGRSPVGTNDRSIGKNTNPVKVGIPLSISLTQQFGLTME